jgi:hypothetical protein
MNKEAYENYPAPKYVSDYSGINLLTFWLNVLFPLSMQKSESQTKV